MKKMNLSDERTKMEEVLTLLNKISIFGGLNKNQVKEIVDLCEIKIYPENSVLFSCGESANHIYVILRGSVNLHFYKNEEFNDTYRGNPLEKPL